MIVSRYLTSNIKVSRTRRIRTDGYIAAAVSLLLTRKRNPAVFVVRAGAVLAAWQPGPCARNYQTDEILCAVIRPTPHHTLYP